MSEQQKTIDALWPVARAIGAHIKEWHQPHHSHADAMHFNGWDGNGYLTAGFTGSGTIVFRLTQHADVQFHGIDVVGVKPEDITIGPITPDGPQKTVSSRVMGTRNETLQDVQRELKYRDLQAEEVASKVASEVGVSVAAGFRQQIGYGSEIAQIQGETELTLNIEASFKQAWENQVTSHREVEIESVRQIVERAMHELVIERVEQVGPAKQDITAKGALTYGIRVHSSGHWWVKWESMQGFLATLQGIGTETGMTANIGHHVAGWNSTYRNHPLPKAKLAPIAQTVYATYSKTRKFEENTNVDVRIKSEPLNDKARLEDALKLVTLQTSNEALRTLAEKELNS